MRLCVGLLKFYGPLPMAQIKSQLFHMAQLKFLKSHGPFIWLVWGLKFSPTLLVGRELHHFIRWSVVLLGVLVRTEGSLSRTPPPLPLARLVSSRHDTSQVAKMSRCLYF